MKTAVSIPDEIFERAEQMAKRKNLSRSELYTTALRSLLEEDDAVTDRLNEIYKDGSSADSFSTEAARRTFDRSEW